MEDMEAYIDDMALMPDGKIVLAGRGTKKVESSVKADGNGETEDEAEEKRKISGLLLMRYNRRGSLDKMFGRKGYTLSDLGGSEIISRIFYQGAGKLLAAIQLGSASTGGPKFGPTSYTWSGLLDGSFGENGLLQTDYFSGLHNNESIPANYAVITEMQAADAVIIVGNVNETDSDADIMMERYQF